MLIPQYTIRWLLTLTAACAVVFSVFGLAVQGSQWAQGASVAIVALVVVLLIHAFLFVVVWVIAPLVPLFFSVAFPPGMRGFLTAVCRIPSREAGPGRSPFGEGPKTLVAVEHGTAASDVERQSSADPRQ